MGTADAFFIGLLLNVQRTFVFVYFTLVTRKIYDADVKKIWL